MKQNNIASIGAVATAAMLAMFADTRTAHAQTQAARGTDQGASEVLANLPVRLSVTEASTLFYNFNNRNSRAGNVSTEVDDKYGWWYNRLSTGASWGSFRADVRMDTALFYTSRSPEDVALSLVKRDNGGNLPQQYTQSDANLFVQKYFEAGNELSTRNVNWTYPAKYSISYQQPSFDLTLGDSYAQFGRGLVLSVRKQDELASDTTLRGVRLGLRGNIEQVRVRLTGVAGTLNPLRLDEASGRFLGATRPGITGLATLTEAGMPRAIHNDFLPLARPNYLPDSLIGGEFVAKRGGFSLGAAAISLMRACLNPAATGSESCQTLGADPSRAARQIKNASLFAELNNLPLDGVLYAEVAGQWRETDQNTQPQTGQALYASINIHPKPVLLTGEFRHYRSYYPLAANIDPVRAREFTPVQYNAPPTTESVWTDTEFEHFNTCVTGGRLRADTQLTRGLSWFAWLGRYDTWGERASTCSPSRETLNRVWDVAQGVESTSNDRATHINAMAGARFDSTAMPFRAASGVETTTFYRELYLRYDIHQKLSDFLSLELRGWHRRRSQSLGGAPAPWFQGTTETGLTFGNYFVAAFGFEYDENPAFPGTYFNGALRYNLTTASNLALFVGQRRGGMRCVSGVCRVFPPFEGARLDATFRF